MLNFIKRAFYKPNWKLAIRETNEEINSVYDIIEAKNVYNTYIPEANYWCADPFLVKENDALYVFCEYCRNDSIKGTIAVAEYKKGVIEKMSVIIEQDYHMSYPCVFKYGSVYYMIPETANNRTIELYRARLFPYEWELSKTLKRDIRCVDSTVFIIGDEIIVIGYMVGKRNKICIFNLDIANETLQLLDEIEDDNSGRPAGSPLLLHNRLFRPSQMSKKKYGEGIMFNEIASIKKGYLEKNFLYLEGKDVTVKSEKKIDRIHTFNRIGNVEIIDYSCDTFELLRPLKILLSKFKQIYSFNVLKLINSL